jgi:hypothetical protein
MQAHEKFRITLLNKYGVLDVKANNYSFPVDGNEAMYQADMDAAGNAEVVIDGLAGIALADLDGCMIEPSVLSALDGWFLKDDAVPFSDKTPV